MCTSMLAFFLLLIENSSCLSFNLKVIHYEIYTHIYICHHKLLSSSFSLIIKTLLVMCIKFIYKFYFRIIEVYLEKEMATHSSILAWRIPGTEEPDGPPGMGSHRVRHDWSDLAAVSEVYYKIFVVKVLLGDLPDNPVVKTPIFQCRGHRFNPWSGR